MTAIGALILTSADEDKVSHWGLITVYPPLALLCVIGLIALFFVAVNRENEEVTLATCLTGVLVLLHGAAALIETHPRFQVAWLHAAFADHLATTGTLATNFDARFAWPGFFAAAGALTRVTGVETTLVFLAWTPVVLVGLNTIAIAGITWALGGSRSSVWTAGLIFLIVDWVGQDYFAPQAVGYVLCASILLLCLTYLRVRPPGFATRRFSRTWTRGWRQQLWRLADPAEDGPDRPLALRQRLALIILIALGIAAVVASHQLTPLVLAAALGLLAATGRLRPWPLAFLALMTFAAWLSYQGQSYWSGHLDDLFNQVGKPGEVVQSGVENRVGGSPEHLLVLRARMLFTAFVGLLAVMGAVWRWRRTGRLSVPALMLAGAPVFMILGGSYGGEGFLRIYFFSLLGLTAMVAWLVFPDEQRASALRLSVAGLIACLCLPVFLVTRFGNEAFERVSTDEVFLAQSIRRVVPPGSALIGMGDMATVQYQGLFTYDVVPGLASLPDPIAATDKDIMKLAADVPGQVYVVATHNQVAAGIENYGYPPDWANQVKDRLLATGDYRQVLRIGDGFVLQRAREATQ